MCILQEYQYQSPPTLYIFMHNNSYQLLLGAGGAMKQLTRTKKVIPSIILKERDRYDRLSRSESNISHKTADYKSTKH